MIEHEQIPTVISNFDRVLASADSLSTLQIKLNEDRDTPIEVNNFVKRCITYGNKDPINLNEAHPHFLAELSEKNREKLLKRLLELGKLSHGWQ